MEGLAIQQPVCVSRLSLSKNSKLIASAPRLDRHWLYSLSHTMLFHPVPPLNSSSSQPSEIQWTSSGFSIFYALHYEGGRGRRDENVTDITWLTF